MKKVEQFTNYDVADKINKFLEEHDVEYVDMKLTDDFVYLIYSDKHSEDNTFENDYVDSYDSLIDFIEVLANKIDELVDVINEMRCIK